MFIRVYTQRHIEMNGVRLMGKFDVYQITCLMLVHMTYTNRKYTMT